VVDPGRFSTLSYLYFGWVTMREVELGNLAAVQRAAGVSFSNQIDAPIKDRDLDVVDDPGGLGPGTGNGGGDTLYRTREGIERFFITDINNPAATAVAQSEVPVMMGTASTDAQNFNHVPGGSNVLYMDGHADFIKYPGPYPVSRSAAEIIDTSNF